jgi:hypothetical protein
MKLTGSRTLRLCVALRQSAIIGFSIACLPALGISGNINLVQNGSFEDTTLTTSAYFSQFSPNLPPPYTASSGTGLSNVADWTVNCVSPTSNTFFGGLCGPGSPLIFLTFPGQATVDYGDGNKLYDGSMGGSGSSIMPATSPDGGNFVVADGNQFLDDSISQTITGLTPGQLYELSFWQAAGQQTTQGGPTTEQWQVSLGNETQSSLLMSNPSEGFQAWNLQDMTFTATSATEMLTFLAVGSPAGGPPFVLLDGVSLTASPEPAFLAPVGVGLFGLLYIRRRRKARA